MVKTDRNPYWTHGASASSAALAVQSLPGNDSSAFSCHGRGIAGGAAFIDTTFLKVNIISGDAEPPRCRALADGGKSSDQRRTGRNTPCGSYDLSSPAMCIKPHLAKIINTDILQLSVCTHTRTSPIPNHEPQSSLHTGCEDTWPFRGNRHVSELSCCRQRPSQVTKSTSNFKSRSTFV